MEKEQFNEQELFLDYQRVTIDRFLKKIKDYDDSQKEVLLRQGYKLSNRDKRTVVFTFGEVTFYRNRFTKGEKVKIPVDELLGLRKYERYSRQLLFEIAKLSTYTSYRKVVEIVETTYKIYITKDIVAKVVKESGEILKEKEDYRFYEEYDSVEKVKADIIYLEGDGVHVKTIDEASGEISSTELSHYVCHTGSQKVSQDRFALENKKGVINDSNPASRKEMLDYIYNHFDINDATILVTNSDHGKGYTPYIFKEFARALKIKRHEHFWDAYHVNQLVNQYFKPFPSELLEKVFDGIAQHDKNKVRVALETAESMISDEQFLEDFGRFGKRLLRDFQYTKPPQLRNLPKSGIGIMESQHRKVTYRMKRQGKYWSRAGAVAMSKLILLNYGNEIEELFFGDWRDKYAYYAELEKNYTSRFLKEEPGGDKYSLNGKYRGRRKF